MPSPRIEIIKKEVSRLRSVWVELVLLDLVLVNLYFDLLANEFIVFGHMPPLVILLDSEPIVVRLARNLVCRERNLLRTLFLGRILG